MYHNKIKSLISNAEEQVSKFIEKFEEDNYKNKIYDIKNNIDEIRLLLNKDVNDNNIDEYKDYYLRLHFMLHICHCFKGDLYLCKVKNTIYTDNTFYSKLINYTLIIYIIISIYLFTNLIILMNK